MARTLLNETVLPQDMPVDVAASGVYQTFDNTNGMYLAGPIPTGGNRKNQLVLHVKNTNAAARTVTIRAGSNADIGPAWRASLGDQTYTVAATTGEQMFHLTDLARFKQADGSINLDVSGAGCTIAAFRHAVP